MFFIATEDPGWLARNSLLRFVTLDQPTIQQMLPVVQAEMSTRGIVGQLHAIELTPTELHEPVHIDATGAKMLGEFILAEKNQIHRELVAASGSSHEFSAFVRSGDRVMSICQKCSIRICLTPNGADLPTKQCSKRTATAKA
ncbi:MAG: hypothetical protein A2751_04510 [Candidatus Doudnabacteria bacterium RIFCSPHIGHO2_01_FULL_46_14]|uniref:Uncharacterized protein n=1 Tax=Candidatus Doudnabacteria bacterium RIFCSPHIGHO2_01_FULL_46_14 TaxID=1817824 RepID=A0A1F5NNG4_9BACT|nr:MAG: hypothetical protein A2751_04510 [Candidatus Doudnabacteria bacterium RIFCSPHIGHO2_01_FULL_46_14]